MKIMLKLVAVGLCVLVLAYLFLMRPGRFQVAALDPSVFVVLDTATGRHHIYEVGLKDDSYELKEMEKGTSLWYRLRMW